MRGQGSKENDLDRMQVWAGQSARLAPAAPAGETVTRIWQDAKILLGW